MTVMNASEGAEQGVFPFGENASFNVGTFSPMFKVQTFAPSLTEKDLEKAVSVVLDTHGNRSQSGNMTALDEAITFLLAQGYIFSADPYEPSGWGEIWAVVLCSILIFSFPGTVALFHHVRRNHGQSQRPWSVFIQLSGMLTRVFNKFLRPSERKDGDVLRLGVEGAAVLYFERELGRLLLAIAMVSNLVLVPLHFAYSDDAGFNMLGKRKSLRSDFIPWTIQNVSINSAHWILWVHITFVYLITAVSLLFTKRIKNGFCDIEMRHAMARRQDGNDSDHTHADGASLFVEGEINFFPSSEHDLRRAFELIVPGHVLDIKIFEQRTRMKSLGEFRSVVTFRCSQYAKEFLTARLRTSTIRRRFLEIQRSGVAESINVENQSESDSLIEKSDIVENSKVFNDLTFLAAVRMERWNVDEAPDPEDIIWGGLTVNRWNFACRSGCVNIALIVCLFIFTTPVAFITFASGVTSPQVQSELQSTFVHALAELRLLSPSLGDFLFGFLPQLLLVICDAWLLFALQMASKVVEPHNTHSGREQSLFRKSFWFLLFNTLLLPSLALSSVGAFVGDLIRNESPFTLLGRAFVTSSGAFTLTLIATQTWVGASMDISRLSERLYFMARGYARPWASAEDRRLARLPHFEFDYGTEYAMALTMFSLCIVFATVTPPILIFGVSYFIVKQATDDHILRHLVTPSDIDCLTRVHIGRTALRHVAVALVLLQSSLFGFFSGEVCLPSPSNNTTEGMVGTPCITNDFKGIFIIRGSFYQMLAILTCLVVTCVVALRDLMRAPLDKAIKIPSNYQHAAARESNAGGLSTNSQESSLNQHADASSKDTISDVPEASPDKDAGVLNEV